MKVGRKEFVYLTEYSLYLAAISFVYNIVPFISKYLKRGIVLILAALLIEPIPIKKLLHRIGIIFLIAVLSFKASAFSTAIFFLFVLAANKVSFEKILKTDFIIRSFGIVISTVLYLFGFAADNILRRYSIKGI